MSTQPATMTSERTDRFWSRAVVDPESECWLWPGARASKGYGRVSVNGKSRLVHRLAYELANGPIPDGLAVCHSCDVRLCMNPEHLWLGTNGDNNRDRAKKGRSACGERHGQSRLTWTQVHQMRKLHSLGVSSHQLARSFGADRRTIQAVLKRETWI